MSIISLYFYWYRIVLSRSSLFFFFSRSVMYLLISKNKSNVQHIFFVTEEKGFIPLTSFMHILVYLKKSIFVSLRLTEMCTIFISLFFFSNKLYCKVLIKFSAQLNSVFYCSWTYSIYYWKRNVLFKCAWENMFSGQRSIIKLKCAWLIMIIKIKIIQNEL